MARIDTVYLAGPDRFHPEAERALAAQDAACAAAGVLALRSAASEPMGGGENGELRARAVYAETAARLRACDAVVVNLSPWRGPNADPGAAFEAGFAAALGKPVAAYMNLVDEDEADLRDRVEAFLGADVDPDGSSRDPDACRIEDMGLPETAMLWAEARRFYVIVTDAPFTDVTGLELCLEALRLYAD